MNKEDLIFAKLRDIYEGLNYIKQIISVLDIKDAILTRGEKELIEAVGTKGKGRVFVVGKSFR